MTYPSTIEEKAGNPPLDIHEIRELKEQCETQIRDVLQHFTDTARVRIESVDCTTYEHQMMDLTAIGSYRNSKGVICRTDVLRVEITVTL